MTTKAPEKKPKQTRSQTQPNAETIMQALPNALLMVGGDNIISAAFGNLSAIFSGSSLIRLPIDMVFGNHSSIFTLLTKARSNQNAVFEHDMEIKPNGGDVQIVDAHAVPLDAKDTILISLQRRSIPSFVERQADLNAAARSVSGLAAMLAHEIKNPLSGIRGAAQLLSRKASGKDAEMTTLICREVDRIHGLVDELDAFSAERPSNFDTINIHVAIDHAKQIALAGFGRNIQFFENYDPSLPFVQGHHDRLIQVLINLFKNASEALDNVKYPTVKVTTSFRHAMWITDKDDRMHKMPIELLIEDNGPGVPDNILDCLFDPFVTSKEAGSGLGLALVARYIADMGGIIEYVPSQGGGAGFKILLPISEEGDLR